jgi:hypothetical protein
MIQVELVFDPTKLIGIPREVIRTSFLELLAPELLHHTFEDIYAKSVDSVLQPCIPSQC